MSDKTDLFNEEHAAVIDKQYERLAPIREALHLLMRLVLADLPAEARLLCVGAGTGHELIALARAFPGWRFTAVEPAGGMLKRCEENAAAEGILDRCQFHEGYVHSLAAGEFDAATSILVSQFLLNREERIEFFRQIARRLRPGGPLIDADLTAADSLEERQALWRVWTEMLAYSGFAEARQKSYDDTWGQGVAVLPEREIAGMIAAGGFEDPVPFFRSLFIRAWFTRTKG